jgi:hypothetical protein
MLSGICRGCLDQQATVYLLPFCGELIRKTKESLPAGSLEYIHTHVHSETI